MEININNGVPGNTAEAEILVDTNGNPISFGSNNNIPTYTYQGFDVVPAALATDIFQLIGSATKIIKVTRIQITANANGASALDFYAFKRTTLNTGGTATHPTPVKYDSTNASSTATLNLYTANPTSLGTGQLFLGSKFMIPGMQGNTWFPIVPVVVDYGTRNSQPIILRGVNESISISLNGQTVPAGTELYFNIEWTEQ